MLLSKVKIMNTKKIKYFLFLFILTTSILSACSNNEQPQNASGHTAPENSIAPELSEINMPYELEKNEETGRYLNSYSICYYDKDCLIVANVFNDTVTATEIIYPEIKTNGLYLLNLSDDKKYTFYDIKSDGWIYSAVPYKDGIIFAEYTGVPDEGGYGWSICYIDGKNKTILDSGCSRTWFTTHLTLLDNKMPIYVCEKINRKQNSVNVQINKIIDFKSENIDTFHNFENLDFLQTNVRVYLACLYEREKETLILLSGDAEGIHIKKEINDSFNSCSITENYIVVSLGHEMGKTSIMVINLDDFQEKNFPQTKRWWRMAGSSVKYCTLIDNGFNPYYIDIENSCVGEILLPEEMESGFLVKSFYPIEKDKFILDINYMDFYIMDLRNK